MAFSCVFHSHPVVYEELLEDQGIIPRGSVSQPTQQPTPNGKRNLEDEEGSMPSSKRRALVS